MSNQPNIEKSEYPSNENVGKVRFTYQRSEFYREILYHGAYGGLNPQTDLHMVFYSQHKAYPSEQVHFLRRDGSLGPPIPTEKAEEGEAVHEIVREIEVGVTMDLGAAIAFVAFLQSKIKEAQEILGTTLIEESNKK